MSLALDGQEVMVDKNEVVAPFERIQAEFPHLGMKLDYDDPNVDVSLTIPRQQGLAFDVAVNLQGDELHLNAGALWLEWFPCDRPEVATDFLDAVCGLLSGSYRIVEHHRGGRPVKAVLQNRQGDRAV